MTPKTITYRGAQVTQNWKSINGTGATLRKPRGWNLFVPGYGSLGWYHSLADARAFIDMYWANGRNTLRDALAKAEGAQ